MIYKEQVNICSSELPEVIWFSGASLREQRRVPLNCSSSIGPAL